MFCTRRRIARPAMRRIVCRMGTCLLSAVLLFSLPAPRSHDLATHLRLGNEARSVWRHMPVSPIHSEAKLFLPPSRVRLVTVPDAPRYDLDSAEIEAIGQISIIQALHRLKLGPRRDSDSEQTV
jgi:hypothetical protein